MTSDLITRLSKLDAPDREVELCDLCKSEMPCGFKHLANPATVISYVRFTPDYIARKPLCTEHAPIGMTGGIKIIPICEETGDEIALLRAKEDSDGE